MQFLQLKPILHNDLSRWKEMRNALYKGVDPAFDEGEMNAIIRDPKWRCLYIMIDDDKVGFVELSLRNIVDGCLGSPVPYIEGIYLYPEYRNKGLGKQVIDHLKKWSLENGYSELAADTELENLSAQGFFKSIGFIETYKTVGFRINLGKPGQSPEN